MLVKGIKYRPQILMLHVLKRLRQLKVTLEIASFDGIYLRLNTVFKLSHQIYIFNIKKGNFWDDD